MRIDRLLDMIYDAATEQELWTAPAARAYRRAPGEARVTLAASSGATIPETARRLNISPNTVPRRGPS